LANPSVSPSRRQSLLHQLDDAERRLDLLEAPRRSSRSLPSLQRIEPLQRHLAPDEAFIEYALHPGQITTFLVTQRTFRVFGRTVGDLDGRILLFNELLSGPSSEEAIRPGLTLSKLLLGDALPVLGSGVHRIFVSVAGGLAALPFDALPDPANPSQPILARYEIAYAPSLLALSEERSHPARRPPYDALALAPLSDGIEGNAWPAQRAELRSLPWSGREVNRITRMMSGHVETLTGGSATETAFKARPLRDFKVIHLATHALLDPQVPSRSAIVFARGSDRDDGWLQPREISSLDLAGQLVVLSACQSAAGTISSAEGMHSLARAFTYAGAQTVVGTLWKVEDSSAAAFVEDMYKSIAAGRPVSGALREAQLRMAGDHPYRNARQWAGWIAAGDPGAKLELEPRRRVYWPALAGVTALMAIAAVARRRPGRRSRAKSNVGPASAGHAPP
jgi:hypothetical protein